jgi:hypothetical protein
MLLSSNDYNFSEKYNLLSLAVLNKDVDAVIKMLSRGEILDVNLKNEAYESIAGFGLILLDKYKMTDNCYHTLGNYVILGGQIGFTIAAISTQSSFQSLIGFSIGGIMVVVGNNLVNYYKNTACLDEDSSRIQKQFISFANDPVNYIFKNNNNPELVLKALDNLKNQPDFVKAPPAEAIASMQQCIEDYIESEIHDQSFIDACFSESSKYCDLVIASV